MIALICISNPNRLGFELQWVQVVINAFKVDCGLALALIKPIGFFLRLVWILLQISLLGVLKRLQNQ